MAAPITLQRSQQEYLGPDEITPRNQTMRKIMAFGALLGLGLMFSYFWVGVAVSAFSALSYSFVRWVHNDAEVLSKEDLSFTKFYLFLGANPNKGATLMWAATRGDCSIMRELLAAGANPNQLYNNDRPPLCDAIANNRDEMVSLLLKEGTDTHMQRVGNALDYALGIQEEQRQGIDRHPPNDFRTREQRTAANERIIAKLRETT